ncbi:MAG: hypothetical protein A2070_08180 [Bdellovibrionales bacterium GWC1_52_8]|nr:MAG: hypothetical protein A2Z97_10400 [Bdellovibrionales bacterium GWB1_52_6]OFZ05997.1 MAG: hypothetical protein A2X97_01520 [Bdellovibrionales bacterium GWA1_52_35]OFZ33063.1 MAG: hypothetical protein A2070_08180 [Bdellovibrionales bacterium GWC1_52_8]HCM39381.1 hypothetical protein [Bdellovibrionales bacterium]
MFPLLAVGALITGTALVAAAATKSPKPERRKPEIEGAVSPAAYLIVPVQSAQKEEGKPVKTASLVELIGKMVF